MSASEIGSKTFRVLKLRNFVVSSEISLQLAAEIVKKLFLCNLSLFLLNIEIFALLVCF
jgi:hypothetical protein